MKYLKITATALLLLVTLVACARPATQLPEPVITSITPSAGPVAGAQPAGSCCLVALLLGSSMAAA